MINSINERRSIRKYQERAVDRELIKELIQAARMASSAKIDSLGSILPIQAMRRQNFWSGCRQG